jgi:hypothetical protein
MGGHWPRIYWLHENGYTERNEDKIISGAARGGHADMVRWAIGITDFMRFELRGELEIVKLRSFRAATKAGSLKL